MINCSRLQKWKDKNIRVYRQIANWKCYLWAGPVKYWESLEDKQAYEQEADLFVMKKWKMETKISSELIPFFPYFMWFLAILEPMGREQDEHFLNLFLPEVGLWVYFFSNRFY